MLRRLVRSAALVVALSAFLGGSLAWCQSPRAKGQGGDLNLGAAAPASVLAVPGYWALAAEDIQKEVGLTAAQKVKLADISDRYQAAARRDWEPLANMPPAEREKRMAALRDKSLQQIQSYRKQVETVLTARQIEALKRIDLSLRAPNMLSGPRVVEQLGLSAAQQEKLGRLQAEMQQKMQQLQREMGEKCLGVLTPQQEAELEKQVEEVR